MSGPPLPPSCNYQLPPELSDGVTSQLQVTNPSGAQTVLCLQNSIPMFPATLQVTNVPSSNYLGNFARQTIRFELMSGFKNSVFMDTKDTILQFRMNCPVATIPIAPDTTPVVPPTYADSQNTTCNLIGSGASFIDAIRVTSNGIEIENIPNYNLIHNMNLTCTVSPSQRTGGLSCTGMDTNSGNGADINISTVAASQYYTYSIPLISILGLLNTEKLFPIGSLANVVLEIDTAMVLPFVIQANRVIPIAGGTTGSFGQITLDQFVLRTKIVDLGPLAGGVFAAASSQGGKLFIKSATWMSTKVTVPGYAGGVTQYQIPIRARSIKSMFFQFQSVATNVLSCLIAPNNYYDSFNWGIQSFQLQVGTRYFPSTPYNSIVRPSEIFTGLVQAWGGSSLASYGNCINRCSMAPCFNPDVFASGNCDSSVAQIHTADSGTRGPIGIRSFVAGPKGSGVLAPILEPIQSAVKYPHSFFIGLDLERVSSQMYNGLNTKNTNPMLTMQLLSGPDITTPTGFAFTHSILTMALVDTVLEIDLGLKTCIVHR